MLGSFYNGPRYGSLFKKDLDMAKDFFYPIEMKRLSALATTNYQLVYDGIPEPCSFLELYNHESRGIYISFDGITDHDYLRRLDKVEIYTQANADVISGFAQFRRGSKIYVKCLTLKAPIDVRVTGYYAPL